MAYQLGLDRSGNNNNFTVTNLAIADQMLDSPTNNFCTGNPLDVSGVDNPGDVCTFSEGNNKIVQAGSDNVVGWKASTIGIRTGKWYFEVKLPIIDYQVFGVGDSTWDGQDGAANNQFSVYIDNGSETFRRGAGVGAAALNVTSANNDIWMFALDLDSPKLWIGHQGTWLASGDPAAGSNPMSTQAITDTLFIGGSLYTQNDSQILINTGNPPYANSSSQADDNGYGDFEYDVPSGFYSICTQNLPEPTVDSANHFKALLYTGTGSNQAVSGVGFQPDLLWVKNTATAGNNLLYDVVRGGDGTNLEGLRTDRETVASVQSDEMRSLDSDGFTTDTGEDTNGDGHSIISFNWKAGNANTSFSESGDNPGGTHRANVAAGFSIVSYTGTGAVGTVAHGLGAAPEMMWVKNRDVNDSWAIYYGDNTDYLKLDLTTATADDATYWNDTSPSSTVFTVNTAHSVNADGEKYIAYCWRSVEGFSKIGIYTGNGNANGTFVNTGFRPAWVFIKRINNGDQQSPMYTSAIDTSNPAISSIKTEDSVAIQTNQGHLDLLSNGFKAINAEGSTNTNGGTYLFMAIAEPSFKYSNAR